MTAEPQTLDEAVIEARGALRDLRAKRASVTAAMSCAGTLADEEALADQADDLRRRERIILDALRAADVHTDL